MGFEPVMWDGFPPWGGAQLDWLANETILGTKDLSLTRFGSQNGALGLGDEGGVAAAADQSNRVSISGRN